MRYSVSFNYRKQQPGGRYPGETMCTKRFKKEAHAVRECLKQKAKGKYVEMRIILSGSALLDFLTQ